MEHHEAVNVVRLGPRIPHPEAVGMMGNVMEIAVPGRIVERTPPTGTEDSSSSTTSTSSSSSSSSSCGANSCEKGVGGSTYSLPIALGIVIPLVGALVLFLYLHRRHVRRQRIEDANDRHASMDFGLGDVPQPGRPRKNKNGPNMTEMDLGGEKGITHASQRSMDFNMESPYLLPPEVQNSRESLHSLSRSTEDPYRPVTQYYPGDEKSIRSLSRNNGSSIYTGSSMAPSRMHDTGTSELLPNASSMPRSHPPRVNSLHQSNALPGSTDSRPPVPPYPSEPPQAHLPEPPHSEEINSKGLPTSPRPGQSLAPISPTAGNDRTSVASDNAAMRQSNNYLGAFIIGDDEAPAPLSTPPETTRKPPPPMINTLPPSSQAFEEDDDQYGDGFKVTPPSPSHDAETMRGQRYSMDVPPEEFAQAGLGAPGFDPKRLSMGFRPLPPDAVTESDDPEIRANRIRSFYKEYFDDSKPDPSGGQYYEDYDENYLGEAAYFDPDTNAFVMPYSQPVTRRAMTPPPRGRFGGPPRALHGSMGAMPGPRGQPGPRAFSSASGRPPPRKPMPPPSALNTLPTPSKLKDDSFALLNTHEFAPPQNYRDRVAGRSDSPLGERRPYSPSVPAFTPTVSAFDELAAMPSPHLLRKSGTFTGLDFAPPKRIRDPDSMSDAGSIRSNRSGISKVQLGAIRSGAYRISRIPKDAVFTKDDLAATLKPSWDMQR
ncbi:hypothetical protein LHYA1_G006081 [Lachnellula hyalina]|uniref:Uncharacterized protein n=1 Tax=Lachnellula hyalina TaxID=1316788 RepID=A0A8H8QZL5_9HELO|nr:uncharacterized protein LHYA1_G006081 [Lachnellula hyalina]TVY25070.1 hypothetical protein LHYA1_G006081 [Lachnellula hyalina]